MTDPLTRPQFKKVKKDAHEVQIGEYEQYQSNEVIELTKMVQAKQVERILKLTAEMKDEEELTELQEKLDKEDLTKRKQVNGILFIFRVSKYRWFWLKQHPRKSLRKVNVKKSSSPQLANTQEIRREQLVAEHKEQMKIVDQLYLKVPQI